MARGATGLTAAKVRTAKPGRYGDGNGLYLLVRAPEARFWLFRYTRAGRMREMGLGRAGADSAAVPLADARQRAADLHRLVKLGIDPLDKREADAAAAKVAELAEAARAKTFRTVAEMYVTANEAGWRNDKHRLQWRSTLETYAYPIMGNLMVAAIETSQVMTVLEPIWQTKPETASRLRGRLEAVLDYASARGWRTGENPARWRGHVANMLPPRSKVRRVEHHAALPWQEIGDFMAELETIEGTAALALRFTILTAARTGEVIGAKWEEIDLRSGTWTVPAQRMKAATEHRVPLPESSLSILKAVAQSEAAGTGFIFRGRRDKAPLSNMAMAMLLRRMQREDLTVHGFRSTFRDWCGEATNYPRDVAEAALAHTLRDKVEAAYRRGDLFEKRRMLMNDWTRFCGTTSAPMIAS
ncbi:site-specific integrase [Acidisoma sp. S159]|uniref:tyrosine-type recombinase/integrase n=1 Tax=Acidisoma sp. S159 TaxID=1747225 RepID=UPI00131DBD23|nr:site-specific integrase [Acidisoma sp. S159]